MGAKDTIVGDEQLQVNDFILSLPPEKRFPARLMVRAICNVQAKITWEARQPEVDGAYKTGLDEGTARVVGFIVDHRQGYYVCQGKPIYAGIISAEWSIKDWEDALKAWGK